MALTCIYGYKECDACERCMEDNKHNYDDQDEDGDE